MTVDLFEFDKSEFVDNIEYGGAATFLGFAGDTDICLICLSRLLNLLCKLCAGAVKGVCFFINQGVFMKMNKIVISLFTVGLMASPLAHATNGYFSHGYGMKAKGMAGAGIALPQDSIAAATDPAGMVLLGNRADLGLDIFKPTHGSTITGGNLFGADGIYAGNGKSLFFIPEFGYNKMLSSDMSLGVSVYGNGGMNTQYDTNPFAAFGSSGTAGINLEQLFIAIRNLAVFWTWSVGLVISAWRQEQLTCTSRWKHASDMQSIGQSWNRSAGCARRP